MTWNHGLASMYPDPSKRFFFLIFNFFLFCCCCIGDDLSGVSIYSILIMLDLIAGGYIWVFDDTKLVMIRIISYFDFFF